jgi:catechol 2,3-dioxygenase-like lactoylglutathione lyase family enzyme
MEKLMSHPRLVNAVIVFVAPDARKTVDYYRDVLGFRAVEHFDKDEMFAALYRDEIEILVVQARFGKVISNQERYGAGYDAYLDPQEINDVDTLYEEWEEKGAKILHPPRLTPYGSYEFVFEDIDGRRIGVGLINNNEVFFEHSKNETSQV